MMQKLKDYLVSLGPRNGIVQLALKLHGLRNGFRIAFSTPFSTPSSKRAISLRRGAQELILAEKDFYLLPFMMEVFSQAFQDIEPQLKDGLERLDFSGPGAHRYRKWDITLNFPGTPEDDSIESYTQWYRPQPGDLIFDLGAHAGFTTCMLARMCGPTGRVIAFEPDAEIVSYLEKNVAGQQLSNVTIVRKAIDAKTGAAFFNQDGTMSAGLVDYAVYGNTGQRISVETLSLEDACREFGVPQFIKMDIEGAEVDVIRASEDFLKRHPIHLAFDSYHRTRDGQFTWMLLEPMLRSYGYEVRTSLEGGQMFTWARWAKS